MKNKYPFLDGLRTIAILMVFYEHIHFYVLLDYFKPMKSEWVSNFYLYCLNKWHWDTSAFLAWFDDLINRPSTGQGTLGVDLFFVLSGFLITRLLVNDCSKLNIGRFYAHRFLKIYPSYFCLIAGTFLFLLFVNHAELMYLLKELPVYLFFFQNVQGQVLQSLGHTWSLVVEEQFYFFYPLIAFVIFKISPSALVRRNLLMLTAILVMLIAPIMRYYYNMENNTAMATVYHFDVLALGCLLALNERFLISMRKFKQLGLAFWLTGVGLYAYLTFIFKWGGDGWRAWYVYDLSALAALNIFLAGYLGVSTLSGLKVFQWIGKRSYGIYLWHLLILIIFFPVRDKISPVLLIILYVPVAVLAGVISTYTVEKYFLNLRQKLIP